MKLIQTFGCLLLALVIGFGAGCAKKKSESTDDPENKDKKGEVAKNNNDRGNDNGPSKDNGKNAPNANLGTGNGTNGDGPVVAKKPGKSGIKKPDKTKIGDPANGGKKKPLESGSGAKRKLRGPKLGDQD